MNIDWSKVDCFTKAEFPEDPDKYADVFMIYSLDKLRDLLQQPIHVSPVSGALARFDNGADYSRHYAVNRKSDAIDIFCETNIFEAWSIAIRSGLWGGVGVYFDTFYNNKRHCMLHLDKRPNNSLWYRHNKKYVSKKDKKFWGTLNYLFSEHI